jgi:hypothetical protein
MQNDAVKAQQSGRAGRPLIHSELVSMDVAAPQLRPHAGAGYVVITCITGRYR